MHQELVIVAYSKVFKCIRSAENIPQLDTCKRMFGNFKKLYRDHGAYIGFLESILRYKESDMENNRQVVFVSGHRDITQEEFNTHYVPRLDEAMDAGSRFVVGDCDGVDIMAQEYVASMSYPLLEVYHMFEEATHYVDLYPTVGGWKSDVDRDWAMTLASDEDLCWIRKGKERSGTAQNTWRRVFKKDGVTSMQEVMTREASMFL